MVLALDARLHPPLLGEVLVDSELECPAVHAGPVLVPIARLVRDRALLLEHERIDALREHGLPHVRRKVRVRRIDSAVPNTDKCGMPRTPLSLDSVWPANRFIMNWVVSFASNVSPGEHVAAFDLGRVDRRVERLVRDCRFGSTDWLTVAVLAVPLVSERNQRSSGVVEVQTGERE